MAKTTRIPDAFASPGGVRQHGGSRPVYRCNTCRDEVVWLESKRTGRPYLVNVLRGYHDQRFYIGADLHPRDCAERRAEQIAAYAAERAKRDQAFADYNAERERLGLRPVEFGPGAGR